ncbi:hypothetical protein FRB99_005297 [Tulasnella sp. 403]|nr:hypothetical protein FRB99_005297 [Tulasnella sp. 403]
MKPSVPPTRVVPSIQSNVASSSASRQVPIQRKILPLGNPPPQLAVPSTDTLAPTGGRPVLRVNRACNACRKQKMRCEGPDNPPCTRCRTSGQQCIFEKVQKPDTSDPNTQRLAELESKWTIIEATLGDVLKELRDVKSVINQSHSLPNAPGGQQATATSPPPSSPHDYRSLTYSPRVGTSSPSSNPHTTLRTHALLSLSQSQLPPIDHIYHTSRRHSPLSNHLPPPSPMAPSPLQPSSHHASFREMPPPPHPANPTYKRRSGTTELYSANNSGDEGDLPSAALAAPIFVVNDIAAAHPILSDEDRSASDSDEERGDARADSSAHRSREKRKRRDSSVTDRSRARFKVTEERGMEMDAGEYHSGRHPNRFAGGTPSMSSVASNSSVVKARRKKTKDVVENGIISVEDAHQLYRNYFSGCHRLLAVFDPAVDTFASIKERSPFLLCALLMVGAKVRDGPLVSELQALLLREATEHAKDRVFESKGRVEDVQALLLLAGWSHSMGGVGWLTAGHAIRVAVEVGTHKALHKLERLVKGEETDPETHRPFITAARTWLALYVFEYQISFGTGRPAMMRGDTAITKAKDILLNHPLSIATDARLVSTCELLTRQADAIHQKLEQCLEVGEDRLVFTTLQDAVADIDAWLEEWDRRMSSSQPTAGFFRSSAAIQRAYAHLFHHCIALRSLKTAEDTKHLSPEMRAIALQAIQSAKECVSICLNNQEYREGLKYAVAYTHTCAAFAGAFLLRFARLFPDDVALGETTEMVDMLAGILSEVPAVSFGIWLRKMLTHTRQRATLNRAGDLRAGAPVEESMDHLPSTTTGEDDPQAILPPPPPTQLPNAQPFVPISASCSSLQPQYGNDPAQIVCPASMPTPTLHPATAAVMVPGGLPTPSVPSITDVSFNDSATGMLQGLLGDGNDWPPWLTTSMVGDLDNTAHVATSTDLTFVWNPPM